MSALCWHCNEPLRGATFTARTPDGEKPACCAGCAAAIETIHGLGLDDYYRFRGDERPEPPSPGEDVDLALFRIDHLITPFISTVGDAREITLSIEGVHCAACVWLIEKALGEIPGVERVRLNLATLRATIRWQGDNSVVAAMAERLRALGYTPRLPLNQAQDAEQVRADRLLLVRLLVAGLGAMQAMMYATALYMGALDGIEPVYRDFFRYAGLLVATPVVFFSGWPFLAGAWRAATMRRVTMDTPVSLALLVGWAGSIWATVVGGEHVYFESLAMFVFFLLVSRWIERRQRRRVGRRLVRLQEALPLVVRRIGRDGQLTPVPASTIVAGDCLQVRQGETVPVDGRVRAGQAALQQAVLTGEAMPTAISAGDAVVAGARVESGLLEVLADGRAADSMLARIGQLVAQAQDRRERSNQLMARLAGRFVLAVLCLSVVALLLHWSSGPVRALEIALAVLVVTCPCALALAAPLTLAATVGRGLDQGILVADPAAFLKLPTVRRVMLDKTGTLTEGNFVVQAVREHNASAPENLRAVLAGLEQNATHPLARPLAELASPAPVTHVTLAHDSVSGEYGGQQWRAAASPPPLARDGFTSITLFRNDTAVMSVDLSDPLRADGKALVSWCRSRGIEPIIASGDSASVVAGVADELGIQQWQSGLRPRDKADWVNQLRHQPGALLMVGDGVNDAPALVQADVSMAVADSAALAREAASVFLLRPALSGVSASVSLACRAQRTLRQNIGWAIGYNLVAIPFAMAGLVPPWLAAIGMSASSLIVTVNAGRLMLWKS